MTDPELGDLLRRYRPAGPSPELRARVLAAPPVARTWPWAAAAALLLAATIVLQLARVQMDETSEPVDPREAAELQVLVEMLGGEERALDEARRMMWERQLRARVEDSRRPPERVDQ
jgi:hypothetical protein